MSQSLSPECTPLKHAYDACFNAWFEGYLRPAVALSSPNSTPEARAAYSKQKAEEYEEKCGKIWADYKACVQVCFHEACFSSLLLGPGSALSAVGAEETFYFSRYIARMKIEFLTLSPQRAVKEKGLDQMLVEATKENPLDKPPPGP